MTASILGALFLLAINCVLATHPHIIVIVADDYGWNNVGYHNKNMTANEIRTPTIDSLVREGIELDRHYVYQFCSPSRSAFLSGRNPIHVSVLNDVDNYNPNDRISGYGGVPLNMTLIPSKLKQAGYATHFTGKWDIGAATMRHLPINRGFDTSLGYLQHANDYYTYKMANPCGNHVDLWEDNAPAYNLTNPSSCSWAHQDGCVYEDDLFTDRVLDEVNSHDAAQPLFYYWAMHATHTPLQVPDAWLDEFAFVDDEDRRKYDAMVNHMDSSIARLIALLQNKGMWEDTVLVFFSDNGGPVHVHGTGASNYPLRGGKMSNWEGGIRSNTFVSGGFVPKAMRGKKLDSVVAVEDWYTTFCALAGVSPVDDAAKKAHLPPVDGKNLWPMLSGRNATNPRTRHIIGQQVGKTTNVQGIIIPPYKLLTNNIQYAFWQGVYYPNATLPPTVSQNCKTGCLYNIWQDPSETNNLAASHPDILSSMQAVLMEEKMTVFQPDRGTIDYSLVCRAVNARWNGFVGPFAEL